jgi:transcriptional regulator with GAF, ATPase, and Fis domain
MNQKVIDFKKVLEESSSVDEIFCEKNPASLTSSLEESSIKEQTLDLDYNKVDETTGFDDSFVIIQKKYIAIETLFGLVNSQEPFKKLLSEILTVALRAIPCEAGSLFELDYNNNCFLFKAVAGKSSKDLLKITVPKDKGVIGEACNLKKSIVLSKQKDPSIHLKSIGLIVGFEAKDVIAAPIIIRNQVFGCIELLNPNLTSTFTNSDIEVLESIAHYASILIEDRLVKASMYNKYIQNEDDKKAA